MESDDAPDWAAIRRAYVESAEPVARICARYHVARGPLYRAIAARGWPRRRDRAGGAGGGGGKSGRAALLDSLYRRLERHLGAAAPQTGSAENGASGQPEPAGEREARTLATLARTLEKLIELEDGMKGPGGQEREAGAPDERDIERLRAELARKFARLARSRGGEPLPEGPEREGA
ncbi:MAG TPA: hypothetical protein PK405_09250 [Hyphomicrobiales bacterium]|nr:hypothetical protein [Rhodobiaceae bacterium]HXK54858.1 hypothetical protein [Hyphomicrobiales bacterium]